MVLVFFYFSFPLHNLKSSTAEKMEFFIKDFFSKCDQIRMDFVTFTEEILNGKLHFFCSGSVIKFVSKRFDMIIATFLFKLSFSQSKINFFRVTGCCCTFLYHTFLSAVTAEGAICLNSTVTIKSLLCFFLNNLFVRSFDFMWHVLITSIKGVYKRCLLKECFC